MPPAAEEPPTVPVPADAKVPPEVVPVPPELLVPAVPLVMPPWLVELVPALLPQRGNGGCGLRQPDGPPIEPVVSQAVTAVASAALTQSSSAMRWRISCRSLAGTHMS
jgi:hypothetical protein